MRSISSLVGASHCSCKTIVNVAKSEHGYYKQKNIFLKHFNYARRDCSPVMELSISCAEFFVAKGNFLRFEPSAVSRYCHKQEIFNYHIGIKELINIKNVIFNGVSTQNSI